MSDLARQFGGIAATANGHLNRRKTGVVFATLMGGWHLLWAIIVAAGWGQEVLDFVLWMHFMKPAFVIAGFSLHQAFELILVTSALGYVFGYVGAAIWNWLHRP